MKNSVFCFSLGLVVIGVCGITMAQSEPSQAEFVGVKSCKMCHKSEEKGNQFGKWSANVHAKAFESLASAESKAVAAKLGISDPQQSPKCLKCHTTTYNLTETVQTDKVPVEEGVSCESCHGAGKAYKSKSVMEDRAACIAAGMIYPSKNRCIACHNEESPTWNPERYTTKDGKKVGFDVDQACEKTKHPNPAAGK